MPLSAAGEKWDSRDCQFVREIMEAFGDERINEISCRCSAQSAKTLTLLCMVAYAISVDPGPILWVTKSLSEAKKLAKSRLMPLLEMCKPVRAKMPSDRNMKTTCEIYFPGAPLIITGADSPASLQSTPFRYIILDEARAYKPGAIEMVSKRTRSYRHSYKKVVISTPHETEDPLDRTFLAGDQCRWFVKCPDCGNEHEVLWGDPGTPGGLKWDENEVTKPGGLWDFDHLAQTIRYECWNEECDKMWTDIERDRKFLASHGRWMPMNTKAPSNVRSFTWNALVPYWAAWREQVREFLLATDALKGVGDHMPLKDHINETRGEPWSDQLQYASEEKFIDNRRRSYNPREPWKDEARRFLCADVQGRGGRHFPITIRQWGHGMKSRKLWHGIVWSWEEVEQMAEEWDVPPINVAIDSGTFTSEVYDKVLESGLRWKAFKGEDKDFFTVKKSRSLFHLSKADAMLGRSGAPRMIPLYLYAKYGILDRLDQMMRGLLGDWQIGEDEDLDEDYGLQVTAYDRLVKESKQTGRRSVHWHRKRKDDHYASCEIMQICCAAASGLLNTPGTQLPLTTDLP